MFCDSPQSIEPTRNTTSPTWSTILRPYWSPSFPYNGVTTVCASRYAVTTHERWSKPPRSPTIVGSAVDTIVASSAASSITSTSPAKTTDSRRVPCASVAPDSVTARQGVVAATFKHSSHAPGKIRTCDLCLRRAALYPLSYGRGSGQV